MAVNTPVALFRGNATTNTGTTLYTVPASTTAIVTSIVISNNSASAQTATLFFDSVAVITAVALAANTSQVIDMKQVLGTTKIITGGASATSVSFHISGVESV
jgi:hypothetical protein